MKRTVRSKLIVTVLLGDYESREHEVLQFKNDVSVKNMEDVIEEELEDLGWKNPYMNSSVSMSEKQQAKDEEYLVTAWKLLNEMR